jgi:hypothetical protein
MHISAETEPMASRWRRQEYHSTVHYVLYVSAESTLNLYLGCLIITLETNKVQLFANFCPLIC